MNIEPILLAASNEKLCSNMQIHIILHMRKVSSGHLLSTEAIYGIQWFC